MRRTLALSILFGVLLAASPLLAQGNPTGRISGTISSQGNPLPGVLIVARSESLQQQRNTVSKANGSYLVPGLPAGDYVLSFELDGFETQTRNVVVAIAQVQLLDVDMSLAAIEEAIVVTGETSSVSETSGSSVTYQQQDLIEKLAINRTIVSAVALAPGTASTGPSGNISISGAQSFDNLYLINGVPVNENLRGQPADLFIEDAIQEITVSQAGVSAEYGRFGGGVVNAVTKSGGNAFHGSLRSNFDNEDWQKQTPFGEDLEDQTNETYEGVLGGYLFKDRAWFFGAGRSLDRTGIGQTDVTNISFPTGTEEDRFEGKLTLTLATNHQLLASAVDVTDDRIGNVQGNGAIDLGPVNNGVGFPEDSFALNYSGIVSDNVMIEAQYSQRSLEFIGIGGTDNNLRTGTPFLDTNLGGLQYHQPIFCGNCPKSDTRETEHAILKGSYFLASGGGSHDLVFGIDTFNDIRQGDNTQSATDFEVWTSSTVIRDNRAFPVVVPFPAAFDTFIIHRPILQSSLGTDFVSNSAYVNDRWQFNDHWSFNLGLRYDENDGEDSAGNKVANDSYVSPRLGASYDVKGNGDLVVHATLGTYVTRLSNGVADNSSAAGNPAFFGWVYAGQPINPDPNAANLVTPEQALDIIFNWFEANGGTASNPFLFDLNIPGATSRIDGSLDSPNAEEITIGASKRLGNRGLVRADIVHREYGRFYFDRSDLTTGTVIDGNGNPQDLTLIQNDDRVLERQYDGLLTSFRYRVTDRVNVAANWTWSHAIGNFDGETTRTGPVASQVGRYPEYKDFAQNFPRSDLGVDQRHVGRAWVLWDALRGDHNRLSLSLLQSFFSGDPYGAAGAVDSRPFVTNPGYVTPPSTVTYWFTAPNAFKTDDVTRTDIAANYSFVWSIGGRDVEIFLQPEVLNVFGEEAIVSLNVSDVDDATTTNRLARFNPFTATPVEGVNWELGSNFGQPEAANHYQFPRTFRFSVGFRF